MKLRTLLLIIAFMVLATTVAAVLLRERPVEIRELDGYPARILSNGTITVPVYLPDAKRGYYRAQRFDWSGIIAHVEYRGHQFWGPWVSPHDPSVNDHVNGPAEEFSMLEPPGFKETPIGDTFLKIGVGRLRKTQNFYSFSLPYELVDSGQRTFTSGSDWIEFVHDMSEKDGYGYHYIKRIALLAGRPALRITHRLVNTGAKPLDTSMYCHNFSVIDGAPTGPAYEVDFPFPAEPQDPRTFRGHATLAQGKLRFVHPLVGDNTFVEMTGFASAADNGFTLRNTEHGAAITMRADTPPSRYALWACPTAPCPEPYIAIKLKSGEEQAWGMEYEFSVK
ncbi:MAG TPA: hypothetical protein VIL86_00080 [Tepidisphaeraceae bacterium]|jgi:hypothetical protein